MSKTILVVEDERNVRRLYKRDFHSWAADAFLTKSSDLAELKNTIGGMLHFDYNELQEG